MAEKIPTKVLKNLLADEFMQQCCICGDTHKQFHHQFEYARKAVNEEWCILPLCAKHHAMVREREFRRLLDWIMLSRCPQDRLDFYSKKVMDYKSKLKWLEMIFSKFSPRNLEHHRQRFI